MVGLLQLLHYTRSGVLHLVNGDGQVVLRREERVVCTDASGPNGGHSTKDARLEALSCER
jgi:hypothetical protein